jgi:hypothetical protein
MLCSFTMSAAAQLLVQGAWAMVRQAAYQQCVIALLDLLHLLHLNVGGRQQTSTAHDTPTAAQAEDT